MKRPAIVLLLCLLAGLFAWLCLHDQSDRVTTDEQSPKVTEAQVADQGDNSSGAPLKVVTTPPMPSATPANPAAADDKTGPRYKRAYMLSLDQGALGLVEAQDIEGDFAPKRGPEEVWSNMLRCRLMSETNSVLAEELLPAPDQVCAVLDPRSTTSAPVNFSNQGPVIFQVRLPRIKDARRLDIYRIIQPGPPITEKLLGSLTLPPP